MRRITAEQKQAIEDASNAGLLGDLNPAFIEKDFHVTEALCVIAKSGMLRQDALKVGPGRQTTNSVDTRVVFSGGTCLSKGHGLIERMSEDID